MEHHHSKLADLRLVAKYFPVSNYSYPRPHTPACPREETRDRESFGSDSSVPGMIDDQGSEVSVEDEYQYHTTGAELWDSFWKAKPKERLSRMRSYPALIKLPAGHSGNQPQKQKQKQKQQMTFGWRCPRTSASNNAHQEDEACWPLPAPDEWPSPQAPVTKTSTISSPVDSKKAADSTLAVPPRTSSLLSPGTPLSPTQIPRRARSPIYGHSSSLSVASSSTSTISNRTSVCTISTAASPPPSMPVSPTVLSPYPPPPEPVTQSQALSKPKKCPSFGNLRKLAFSKAPAATITVIGGTQIQQPPPPLPSTQQASPPCFPPSIPFCVPSRRAPAPPPPPPQVSVFEYDSDSDSDAGSSDEDESSSSSRNLARRIVRGIAHRGRHHRHHSHHHHPRPRSASDSGGARVPMGSLAKEVTRARAETVGAAAEVRHVEEGVGRPRRQAYDVFGRILGRRSR